MNAIAAALTEIAAKDAKNGLVFPSEPLVEQLQESIRQRTKSGSMTTPYEPPFPTQREGWANASPLLFEQEAGAFFSKAIEEIEKANPKASQVEIVCHN